MNTPRVLVTGGNGYLGQKVVRRLAAAPEVGTVVSVDIAPATEASRLPEAHYLIGDVRGEAIAHAIATHDISAVVHLASIVNPGKNSTREFEYSVDVEGTRNVLHACLEHEVEQLVVTSSGAAYGYWPDNPEWLHEDDALRGNESFAYSHHKRLVEEMLTEARAAHPKLQQLILRPGTILGRGVRNQITNLFLKPVVFGVAGSPTPFVFIWDEDVAEIIVEGVIQQKSGIYNVAGDGAIPLRDLARMLGKPFLPIPATIIQIALATLKPLGLTRYGPEQVNFLRYRPVLANDRLKTEFGYRPEKTSKEVFELFLDDAGLKNE